MIHPFPYNYISPNELSFGPILSIPSTSLADSSDMNRLEKYWSASLSFSKERVNILKEREEKLIRDRCVIESEFLKWRIVTMFEG